MEFREDSILNSFPLDVAERVVSFLAATDIANLRLVNKHWRQFTNRYVTTLRPQSLSLFFQGTLPKLYPAVNAVDLSAVDVDETQLRPVAQTLAQLPALDELTLQCREVGKRGFDTLAITLPRLKRFGIRSSAVMHQCCIPYVQPLDLDVVPFDRLRFVVHLDLSWNTVTLNAVRLIATLPNVEILNFKNCLGVDDSILEVVAEMFSLKVLNLSYTNITDDGLMVLNDVELEILNLSKCEGITDDGMFFLQHVRSIKKLDISSCPGITEAGVELLATLPNLMDLYLQDFRATGSSFFKKMNRLTTISLRDCCWVKDSTLWDLIQCKTVQSLNLRNCNQITDAGLNALRQLPLLRSVNLRGCTNITDAGIEILSSLPKIEDVDLSFLNQITDVGLGYLTKATSLRRLILNWCHLITSVGLHQLRSTCPQLQELSIKGCHNMQFTDLVSMARLYSVQKLDYEHSLCSIQPAEQKRDLPLLRHIDSFGCFLEIC